MVIGKIIPRKYGTGSFKDSVNYNLGLSRNDRDKVEYVNTLNIFAPEVAAAEMQALAFENTRSADPVFNCILSWRENEIPTREQTDEAVDIALKELGLDGCLCHYALHRNTENMHLHICVNRIDPETYRARDPAHGWTKKALEKAARKIELAQGWEIERTGRYVVTENGEILEKPQEEGKVKLSQTARDIEAHTGEKSAERIGQEIAAPIIREAKSWKELHQSLAEHGIKFDRKGSGAVLRIGEVVIKASQAGRDISLSKLEKRLGAYLDQYTFRFPLTPEPKPIERIEAAPKVKHSWEDYRKARTEYLNTKNQAFSEQRKRQEAERKTLTGSQREERASLFRVPSGLHAQIGEQKVDEQTPLSRVSWKGKGAELNQRRSIMAAKQQKEKLDLRDRHAKEREKLRKHFPHQFPSFKKWLSLEDDTELFALYRYPGQLVIFAADGSENLTPGKSFDLRDYSPVFERRGGVMYCKNGKSVADFIDYGKRIVVSDKFDEASVLAALQLSSQKWGSIQIAGSEEYKNLCVRLAAKHNFKLANMELQEAICAARKVGAVEIKPEVGQRVTFHAHGTETSLTGNVIGGDESRGTVTLLCGSKQIPVFAAKGYFTEAAPLDFTHTKEYAIDLAKKHAGENGFVFLAQSEGVYRGPIIATTPTFTLQKTRADTITLHRLKDLEGFIGSEMLVSKNLDVVIRKAKGIGTVSIEPQRSEKDRKEGLGR